jgi:hypothetical protein
MLSNILVVWMYCLKGTINVHNNYEAIDHYFDKFTKWEVVKMAIGSRNRTQIGLENHEGSKFNYDRGRNQDPNLKLPHHKVDKMDCKTPSEQSYLSIILLFQNHPSSLSILPLVNYTTVSTYQVTC